MIQPRLEKLKILGLGSSIGTSSKGIIAKAVVVRSFDELIEKGADEVYYLLKIIYKM